MYPKARDFNVYWLSYSEPQGSLIPFPFFPPPLPNFGLILDFGFCNKQQKWDFKVTRFKFVYILNFPVYTDTIH